MAKLLTVDEARKLIEEETKRLVDRACENIVATSKEQLRQLEIQRDALTVNAEISTLVQAAALCLVDDVNTKQFYSGDGPCEAFADIRVNGGGVTIPNPWNGTPRPRIPSGKYRVLVFFLPLSK